MYEYLVPFLAYVLAEPLLATVIPGIYAYAAKVIITVTFLTYYLKQYKLKWSFSIISFFAGLAIFFIWILPEGLYPMFSQSLFYPADYFEIMVRFTGSLLAAPLIEELFIRSFLNRNIISKDWEKVPIGKFTKLSFVATALVFGFAHNRWLPGIITGVILNWLLIKKKNITECIFAHFVANLVLGIYVVVTQSWFFW